MNDKNKTGEQFIEELANMRKRIGELEALEAERKQAEEELERFKSAVETSSDAVGMSTHEGRHFYQNKAFNEMFGDIGEDPPGSVYVDEKVGREVFSTIMGGDMWKGEIEMYGKGKKLLNILLRAYPNKDENGKIVGLVGAYTDITEYKQLEEQFRQAQKMEAIGQLAGGVAHDFNNLLTIISGHTDLALMEIDPANPLHEDLKEVLTASNRAADLTRQLLAFSRKQTLSLRILNLNDIVNGLEKMMRRTIGEDIDLITRSEDDLWSVKADPGQIEQVIINLVVNARDAMPQGGKLTIETQNVELDEEYARTHVEVKPGSHVMLAVSDSGCGMSEEHKNKIFDPFFTTKERGKGTGLGLSTVYGIVKQSGGNIWVYSELGKGTSFKIYLPMVSEEAEEFVRSESSVELPRGSETVLIVEDEDGVRHLVTKVLKRQGYKTMEAQSGDEALRICLELEKPVDLLITDVIMPIMGGVELVEKLQEIWSDLKVLFMSGYTTNAIIHNGTLDKGTNYLQKPSRPVDIAWKVRRVLDA